MASHNELSRLAMDISITAGTGRLSRNSQGICHVSPHTTRSTTLLSDAPSMPGNSQFTRIILTEKGTHSAPDTPNTLPSDRQVGALTPCMRQHDRFVNPSGKLLQPGTVIVCKDFLFVVSSNGKIYNFTGGNMRQLYIADPSKYKFLVTATNSLSTFSNIFSSVLGLSSRFGNRQSQVNKHKDEDQEQSVTETSTIETIHSTNSTKDLDLSNNPDMVPEDDVLDLVNLSADVSIHHDAQDTASHQENLFQNDTHNEMFNHYNRVVIGCFKDIFQPVKMDNPAEVLQALKELNFMLANTALELAVHYNMPLEP